MKTNKQAQKSYNLSQALYSHALKLTGSHHQAEELILQTTARIKQVAASYTPIVSFVSWAKMVMENTFHETFKNSDIDILHHTAYQGTISPIEPGNDREYTLKEQIHMMSLLTPHQAAATTLRLSHYTHNAIASKMGITTTQVKAHLTKARNILNHAWDN